MICSPTKTVELIVTMADYEDGSPVRHRSMHKHKRAALRSWQLRSRRKFKNFLGYEIKPRAQP